MIFLLPMWSPENAYLVGVSLKQSSWQSDVALDSKSCAWCSLFSVSCSFSSVEPLSPWKRLRVGRRTAKHVPEGCCCPSQDEHSSGDRGSGRIWHGQTLEKAVDRGARWWQQTPSHPARSPAALGNAGGAHRAAWGNEGVEKQALGG